MTTCRQEEIFLKISKTIFGIQKIHSFVPLSKTKILTRTFLNSSVSKEERVTRLNKTEILIDKINSCVYEDNWWLGCVLQVNQDDKTLSINIREDQRRKRP